MAAPTPNHEELLAALAESQARILALEAERDETDWLEHCLRRRTRELSERVKELECLYRVSELLDGPEAPTAATLTALADALPHALQRPQSASARVAVRGRAFETPGFAQAAARLSVPVRDGGREIGAVEVGYTPPIPPGEPFLKEERQLLQAVADRLGSVLSVSGEML